MHKNAQSMQKEPEVFVLLKVVTSCTSIHVYYCWVYITDSPATCDSKPNNADSGGGHDEDVVESRVYATVHKVFKNTDESKYDPLIKPTLPILVNYFKHHVSKCHLDDNDEFKKQYDVSLLTNN